MEERIRGLVVRETLLGESDKLLSVLTAEYGRITVMAKGARSMRSKHMASSQLMCYSEMTLYRRDRRLWLREALPVETFYGIRLELDCFALVQYMFDVCCDVCPEDNADGADEMLRLLLNSLYAIISSYKSQEQIKAAFEFKTAALSGLTPELSGCSRCGKTADTQMLLDLVGGTLLCDECVRRAGENERHSGRPDISTATAAATVSPAVLTALRYIERAPIKRFLSFSLPEPGLSELCYVCEAYLCNQLERGFETLDFWHEMRERYASEDSGTSERS